ncbi:MAG: adenylate/guanylate cyclase domain-containing protein [Thermodesulfobacteriota bacterium]|nr:adenylate/guanylate cyclase domain-containing protein [Thermodesulfobacteriota bacterium]
MGIAPQIAISIHNARSYQQIQEGRQREFKLRRLFEKYVPAPIIKRYLATAEADLFGGDVASITAMFLDIRGFTARSEDMEASRIVSFLNAYFERCSVIISENHGHINKYTGDGFLAIFGAPEPLQRCANLAFDAAAKILNLYGSFVLGCEPIEVGIGLHSGTATLGNIGSQTKIEYTAIGDTVNVAARLQELTKTFQEFPLIMSRHSWNELAGHPYHDMIRNLGKLEIRGKKEKLEAFGFSPFEDHRLSGLDNEVGFLPLHRIKGV